METLLHGAVEFVLSHPALTLTLLLGWWVFSALVRSMPLPEVADTRQYKFLFAFLHNMKDSASGSLARALASRTKPVEQSPPVETQALIKKE
jgi:hypothetical protein